MKLTTGACAHVLDYIVMWPFRLMGLTGADGYLSFSKMMALSILAAYVFRMPIPMGVVISLLAASFGVKAFLAMLESKTLTANETLTTTLDVAKTAEVLRRRDPSTAMEPTP